MTHAPSSIVHLGLGSNVGDRLAHLTDALRRLSALGAVEAVSGVYETDPVGFEEQPRFLNLVVRIRVDSSPHELLAALLEIEASRGRTRRFMNAPRTLDMDILLYDGRVIDDPELTVPHPRMSHRAFVLVPLLELDPDLVEPGTGVPYGEHLAGLTPADDLSGHTPLVNRIMDGERLLDDE
jgi:2-amino-4-hydroxy-6-hydroxymethyldihydropteridine diphosphokinase